jgi:hypothetical protein
MPLNRKLSIRQAGGAVLWKYLVPKFLSVKPRGGRCPVCNNLDLEGHELTCINPDGSITLQLESNYGKLMKGEKQGCGFCRLVHEILDLFYLKYLPPGTMCEHMSIYFMLEKDALYTIQLYGLFPITLTYQIYTTTGKSHVQIFLTSSYHCSSFCY